MVTASKIPVPDPMAPMKSAVMVNKPTQTPPKKAATGILLFKGVKRSECPLKVNF